MLILAIVGIVCCAPCGLIAFIMARNALKDYPNDGTTKAAYWIGLVAIILWILGVLIGMMVLGMASSATGGGSNF